MGIFINEKAMEEEDGMKKGDKVTTDEGLVFVVKRVTKDGIWGSEKTGRRLQCRQVFVMTDSIVRID